MPCLFELLKLLCWSDRQQSSPWSPNGYSCTNSGMPGTLEYSFHWSWDEVESIDSRSWFLLFIWSSHTQSSMDEWKLIIAYAWTSFPKFFFFFFAVHVNLRNILWCLIAAYWMLIMCKQSTRHFLWVFNLHNPSAFWLSYIWGKENLGCPILLL